MESQFFVETAMDKEEGMWSIQVSTTDLTKAHEIFALCRREFPGYAIRLVDCTNWNEPVTLMEHDEDV